MSDWKKTAAMILVAVIFTAAITAGITANLIKKNKANTVELTLEEYSQLKDLFVLDEIMDQTEANALEKAPDRSAMIAHAAKGVVASLNDPYAAYYTPEEYEAYLSNVNGTYTGIGMLIGQPKQDGAPVLDVYDGYSAQQAGVRVGDIITSINGKNAAQMTLDDITDEADGELDSVVQIDVLRNGEALHFELTSMQINISQVSSALFNERTAYIRINRFTGNCVGEFEAALKDKTERGMRSLVIDLRNNPGGSLENVVSIADTILGKCTIVTLKGNNDAGEVFSGKGKGIDVPIAILVNENSASASEILAAAVQDNDAGTVIGMTTFGKGIVQTTSKLSGNTGWLKLTTEEYFTPSGKNIDGVGVMPDIEVDLPDDMKGVPIQSIDQEDDAQLWEALDCVRDQAAQQEQ